MPSSGSLQRPRQPLFSWLPGPGPRPLDPKPSRRPRGWGSSMLFLEQQAIAANSKELSLPPEPGVPWPPTPDLTETQGPPVASQPGIRRRGGCSLMFPAGPLCPRSCVTASPLGFYRQSVPSSSNQAQEDQALPATVLSRGHTQKPASGSVRPVATGTARTSLRGLC